MATELNTFKKADDSAASAATSLNALSKALLKLDAVASNTKIVKVSAQLSSIADSCKELSKAKIENLSTSITSLYVSLNLLSNLNQTSLSTLKNIIDIISGVKLNDSTSYETLDSISKYTFSLSSLLEVLPEFSKIDSKSLGKLGTLSTAIRQLLNSFSEEDISKGAEVGSVIANISALIRSIARLPKAIESVNKIDSTKMAEFINRVKQLCNELAPLQKEFIPLLNSLNALPKSLNSSVRSLNRFSSSSSLFGRVIQRIFSGAGIIYMFRRFTGVLKQCFTLSNNYIETLNLFSVSLGKNAEAAYDVVEAWQDLLGVDMESALKMWSSMNSLLMGFGDGSSTWQGASYKMSQNLTQLSYDMASLYNMDFETAFEKLQSGISGMSRPLRELGIDVSQVAIKETALKYGIDKTVESMTQAEKAQLRYLLIMEKTSESILGVQGDLSKTLTTPGNAIRILKEQVIQLGRAFGDLITPVLSEMLPIIREFVTLLTVAVNKGAEALRNILGYTKEELKDFSATAEESGESGGALFDDTTDSINEASEALYGLVSGIDKFTVLSKAKDSSGLGEIFDFLADNTAFDGYIARFLGFRDLEDGTTALEQYYKYLEKTKSETVSLEDAKKRLEEAIDGVSSKLKDTFIILTSLVASIAAIKVVNKISMVRANIIKTNSELTVTQTLLKSIKNTINSLAFVALIVSLTTLITKWDELNNIQKFLLISLAAVSSAILVLNTNLSIVKPTLINLFESIKKVFSSLQLSASVITLVIGAFATFSYFNDELSKTTKIMILLSSALFAAAAGLVAFKLAKDAVFGSKIKAAANAAAITGSIAIVTGTLLANKNKFADGGYISPGATFIAGEAGPEWVGRQGSTSTIINDAQMSDIMYDAVRDGVYDAMKASNSSNTNTLEIVFDTDGFIKANTGKIMREAQRQRWEVQRR